MKHWGAHKTIGIASAGVALVLAAAAGWLLTSPPTAGCGAELSTDPKVHRIHATKVTVRPWLGRHEVYGFFMVPKQYKHNREYLAALTVRGFDGTFVAEHGIEKPYGGELVAPPGQDVWRSYFPTRDAAWLLFRGLLGELRNPCNWTLVFVERSPAMRGDH